MTSETSEAFINSLECTENLLKYLDGDLKQKNLYINNSDTLQANTIFTCFENSLRQLLNSLSQLRRS